MKNFYILTKTLILALVLFGPMQIVSGQTVQLGTGTATNGTTTSSPVNIWYRRSVEQFVYTAAELNAAGIFGPCDLQDIGWYVTQSPLYNIPGYTVKMKHVTVNNVAGALGTGGWNTVKNAFTYNPTAGGWDMLGLNNTFQWNGTDNIGVEICWSQVQPNYNSSGRCRIYSTASGYRYSWTDGAGNSCGSTPGSQNTNKPQAQMVWSCAPPCTTPSPPNASGTTISCGSQTTLTASGAPASGNYIWYSDPNGNNQVGTGSSFTTPTLASNTTYYASVFVPTNCESSLVPVTVNVTSNISTPTANGITINCGDPATLNASGSTGNYEWFGDANGNNSIGTGNSVSLGNLYADSTVYVAATSGSQTGPPSVIYDEDWQSGNGGWTLGNAGPYWNRISGGTGSTGTGPNGGSNNATPTNGNFYVYLETSTGAGTAYLTGPGFTITGAATLQFDYHMYGSNMGTLGVEVFDGTSWTQVWSLSGQQQTSNAASWTTVSVPLTNYSGNINIRFRGLRGSSYRSDMAVDNVSISETQTSAACLSSLVPVTVTVNGPTPPTANGITINCGDPATLTASGSTGNYEWFSDANGNNSIGTGNSTSLGNLYADSTVYVSATTSTQASGSDIYNIDLGNLVGVGSGSNNTRYTCGASGQGFQWADASPAGATITSITLEFKIGVECQPGNKNSALNSAAQPNFNSAVNHCSTASPGPGSFITMNLTPAAYSVGGNNIFTTSGHGSCFGFERSATLSNYFARVTVNYTYGAQGCESSLVPVTATVVPSPGVTVTGTTQICSSNTTTLNASGTSVQWYSDANGANVVGTGNNFTTPALTANTTYYAGEAPTSNSGTYDQTIQVSGGSGLSGSTAFSFPGTPTGATGTPTLTITSYGDIDGTGGNLEQWRVDDENGAVAGLAGGLGFGQCSATATTVVNVTTAQIDAWAANGTINFTGVDPTGNINYTLCGGDYLQLQLTYNYATGSPCAQQLTQVDITVDQPSTAATSISGVGSTCLGTTSTLSVQGGTLNGTSTWQWFSGNCTGTPLGTGTSISVTPSSTTTYFVSASGSGACPATACASGVVTLPTPSNTLSLNAETGTCPVNQGGYIHLLTSTGRLVASINSNGQNLGDVTATSYLETSPLLVDNCNNIGNPYWQVSVDNRHWVITTTIAPSAPVEVLLPTTDAEWQQLQANAFNNGNPNDDIFNGLTDVGCTKYSGPNENANFPDNCGQGGAFTWHSQTSNGNINAMAGLTGHAATDKYITVNVNSFSEFWLHGSSTSSPLPVELTSYAANCVQDGTVRLKWTTASESESSHFTVERSTNSDDWTLVNQVNAMGHSQSTTLYSVDDELTNRQNVYYRLRQYDLNGDMKDELITSANCIWEDMNQFTVYPNPASSNVQVVLSATVADDQAFIQLSNPEGRTILNQPVKVEKGNNAFHLNLDSLPPGVYLIDLRGERIGLLSSRIVKTD